MQAQQGQAAAAGVAVQDRDVRRSTRQQAIHGGIDFVGQQLAGLVPARTLPGNALQVKVENTVHAFHIGFDKDLAGLVNLGKAGAAESTINASAIIGRERWKTSRA